MDSADQPKPGDYGLPPSGYDHARYSAELEARRQEEMLAGRDMNGASSRQPEVMLATILNGGSIATKLLRTRNLGRRSAPSCALVRSSSSVPADGIARRGFSAVLRTRGFARLVRRRELMMRLRLCLRGRRPRRLRLDILSINLHVPRRRDRRSRLPSDRG